MRCPRCGNENPETNRFCGMCGATLLQETAPTEPAPSSVTASSSVAVPGVATPGPAVASAPLPSTPRSQAAHPVISGPSFLGLNEPPPATRRRGSLSIDPHSAHSSRDLNYLLDDDEEPRGGAGKYILILLALGLAVGFGYLRWKNQGFAWLNPSAKKPVATAPNPEAPDGSSPAPSIAPADANPTPSSPSPSGSSQPAASSTSPASTNSSSAGATLAAGSPTPSAASTQPVAAPASGDTGASGAAPAAATNPAATAAKDQERLSRQSGCGKSSCGDRATETRAGTVHTQAASDGETGAAARPRGGSAEVSLWKGREPGLRSRHEALEAGSGRSQSEGDD